MKQYYKFKRFRRKYNKKKFEIVNYVNINKTVVFSQVYVS